MIDLTLLHINDIHGDFLPETVDGDEVGGIALLSGYLKKVRSEEENVLFAIAGDMFRGSIIDSEYMGMSTIELMNNLSPDVATIGNHEVDYGLAHLLFLEKCAKFPIINANTFITTNHVRLFNPYIILERGGLKIMFIGIITDEILATTKSEGVIGSFVDVQEAAKEINVICDTYKTVNIDYTVVLSHIGFDNDCKLAREIATTSGVDLIIGGHTHTLLEEPHYENGIPIVQTGTGTNQLGRIDMKFDEETHALKEFNYQIVPITSKICKPDKNAQRVLESYKDQTDFKYSQVLTTFNRVLTHPARNQETELGNLFADVMQDGSSFDVMLIASGSIRSTELGPILQLQDLKTAMPYDGPLYLLEVTGDQLKRMFTFMLREETFTDGSHTEFYQVSNGLKLTWSREQQKFLKFQLFGKDIEPEQKIRIGMQSYHYQNFSDFFNLPIEEVMENHKPRVVGSSVNGIYEELLSGMRDLDAKVEGRIEIV